MTAFVSFLFVQLVVGVYRGMGSMLKDVIAGRYGLVSVLTGMPSAEQWAGATLVWMGLALAAVVAAAHRHQER